VGISSILGNRQGITMRGIAMADFYLVIGFLGLHLRGNYQGGENDTKDNCSNYFYIIHKQITKNQL
jgi:hypothetical protein